MLSPLLIILVISIKSGFLVLNKVPSINDEVDYWRENYSFIHNGFNFGKYGFLGYQKAKWGSFGGHGYSTIIPWLWYSLISWNVNSIVIANTITILVSLLLFVLLVKPDYQITILLILFILSYRHFNMYLGTSLMEVPCFAAMIIYVALLIRFKRDNNSKLWFILCCLSAIYCTMLRLPYIVLLLPVLVISNDCKIDLKLFFKLLMMLVIAAFMYVLYANTISSYVSAWSLSAIKNIDSIGGKLGYILSGTLNNLSNFHSHIFESIKWYFDNYASFYGIKRLLFEEFPPAYFMIRLLLIGLLVYLLYKVVTKKEKEKIFYLSLFLMLLGYHVGIICFYSVDGYLDVRTTAPVLFTIIFYMISTNDLFNKGYKYWVVGLSLLSILILIISPKEINPTNNKDYTKLFSVLDQNKSINITMSLKDEEEDDAMAIMSAIPPVYGIELYVEEGDINKYHPVYVFSKTKLDLKDYKIVNEEEGLGYIYEHQ